MRSVERTTSDELPEVDVLEAFRSYYERTRDYRSMFDWKLIRSRWRRWLPWT